jgi:hypothetical protein
MRRENRGARPAGPTPRMAFVMPAAYRQLLRDLAARGRRSMTAELLLALEERAARVGVPFAPLSREGERA